MANASNTINSQLKIPANTSSVAWAARKASSRALDENAEEIRKRFMADAKDGTINDFILLASYNLSGNTFYYYASDENLDSPDLIVEATTDLDKVDVFNAAPMLTALKASGAVPISAAARANNENSALLTGSINTSLGEIEKKGNQQFLDIYKQYDGKTQFLTGIDGNIFVPDASIFEKELTEDDLAKNRSFQEASKLLFEDLDNGLFADGQSWHDYINDKIENDWADVLNSVDADKAEALREQLINEEAGKKGLEHMYDLRDRMDKMLVNKGMTDKGANKQKALEYMRDAFEHSKSKGILGTVRSIGTTLKNGMIEDKVGLALTGAGIAISVAFPPAGAALALGGLFVRNVAAPVVAKAAAKYSGVQAAKVLTGSAIQATGSAATATLTTVSTKLSQNAIGRGINTGVSATAKAFFNKTAQGAAVDAAAFNAAAAYPLGRIDHGVRNNAHNIMAEGGFNMNGRELEEYRFWVEGLRDIAFQGSIGYVTGGAFTAGGISLKNAFKGQSAPNPPQNPATPASPNSAGRLTRSQAKSDYIKAEETIRNLLGERAKAQTALDDKVADVQREALNRATAIADQEIANNPAMAAHRDDIIEAALEQLGDKANIEQALLSGSGHDLAQKVADIDTASNAILQNDLKKIVDEAEAEIAKIDGKKLSRKEGKGAKIYQEATDKMNDIINQHQNTIDTNAASFHTELNNIDPNFAIVDPKVASMENAAQQKVADILQNAKKNKKKAKKLEKAAMAEKIDNVGRFLSRRDRKELADDILAPGAVTSDLNTALVQINKDIINFLKNNPKAENKIDLVNDEIERLIKTHASNKGIINSSQEGELIDALEEQAETYLRKLKKADNAAGTTAQQTTSGPNAQNTPDPNDPNAQNTQEPNKPTDTNKNEPVDTSSSEPDPFDRNANSDWKPEATGTAAENTKGKPSSIAGGPVSEATGMHKDSGRGLFKLLSKLYGKSPTRATWGKNPYVYIYNDTHIGQQKIKPLLKYTDDALNKSNLTQAVTNLKKQLDNINAKMIGKDEKPISKAAAQKAIRQHLEIFNKDNLKSVEEFSKKINIAIKEVKSQNTYNAFGQLEDALGNPTEHQLGQIGFNKFQKQSALDYLYDLRNRINLLTDPDWLDDKFAKATSQEELQDTIAREIYHIHKMVDQANKRHTSKDNGSDYYSKKYFSLQRAPKNAGWAELHETEHQIITGSYIDEALAIPLERDRADNAEVVVFRKMWGFQEEHTVDGKTDYNSEAESAFSRLVEQAVDGGEYHTAALGLRHLMRMRGPDMKKTFPENFIRYLEDALVKRHGKAAGKKLLDKFKTIIQVDPHNNAAGAQRDTERYVAETLEPWVAGMYFASGKGENWLARRVGAPMYNKIWEQGIKYNSFERFKAHVLGGHTVPDSNPKRDGYIQYKKGRAEGQEGFWHNPVFKGVRNTITLPGYPAYWLGKQALNVDINGAKPVRNWSFVLGGSGLGLGAGTYITEYAIEANGYDVPEQLEYGYVPAKLAWNSGLWLTDHTMGLGIRAGTRMITGTSELILGGDGIFNTGFHPADYLHGDNFLGFDLYADLDGSPSTDIEEEESEASQDAENSTAPASSSKTKDASDDGQSEEQEEKLNQDSTGGGLTYDGIGDSFKNGAGHAGRWVTNQITLGNPNDAVGQSVNKATGALGDVWNWYQKGLNKNSETRAGFITATMFIAGLFGYGLLKKQGGGIGNVLKFAAVAAVALLFRSKWITGEFNPSSKPMVASTDSSGSSHATNETKTQVGAIIDVDDRVTEVAATDIDFDYDINELDRDLDGKISGQGTGKHGDLQFMAKNITGISDAEDQILVTGLTNRDPIKMPKTFERIGLNNEVRNNVFMLRPSTAANASIYGAPEHDLTG